MRTTLFLILFFSSTLYLSVNGISTTNSTSSSTSSSSTGARTTRNVTERPHLNVINFNFHHAELPIFLSAAAVGIIIFKSMYYAFPILNGIIPDSSMMLLAGLVVGGCLHWFFPDREFRLEPTWFFWGMLPMIVLDAGYFVPTKDFVNNIGAITSFAVFGTLSNIFLTSVLLYLLKTHFLLFETEMTITDILIFSTLISAVDPVAVISVFEEIHVNRQLYILVFGESLLNDATTIVFYNTFQQFSLIGAENIVAMDIFRCIMSFTVVSFGGIVMGIMFGALTGLMTKLTRAVELYQPLTCLLLPYFAYSAAEGVGVSGILALTFCGLTMKNYLAVNVKDSSLVSFNYMLKTLSSFCETMIFVMLGVSAVSRNHVFDFWFVVATLFACLIFRFITIYSMTYFLNKAREEAISLVDQFVIAYGGIRGAVCYGLVVALDKDMVAARDMFTTTTVAIILFTSLVQGGTIKCLVNKLKVKHAEPEEITLFELVMHETMTNCMEGLSAIAFVQPEKKYKIYFRQILNWANRHLMVDGKEYNSKCRKIVAHSQQIMISEAVSQIKKFGSYRLLPSYPSMNTMPTSQSVPANMNEQAEELNEISLRVPQPDNMVRIKIDDVDGMGDRKKSLRTIFKGAVSEYPEEKKPQMYSRHFMHDLRRIPYERPLTPLYEGDEDEDQEGSKNYLTFPNTENDFLELNTFSVPVPKKLSTNTNRPSILPGKPTRPRFEVKLVRNRPSSSHRRRNSSTGPEVERLMLGSSQRESHHESLRRGSTPNRNSLLHRPKVKFAIEGDSP